MDFDLTPEEEAFGQEVRAFLAEHLPSAEERKKIGPSFLPEWWRLIREKRWVGFDWPKECGGGGGTISHCGECLELQSLCENAQCGR
mgnify:CR=1 FL=1